MLRHRLGAEERAHRFRPNLEDEEDRMNKGTLILGLGLFSWSCESAASEATMNVLLFLLSWFENLQITC